jgi:catechol 2,3-dioxygenase-like lactoylglutathione lyase family enzyme
MADLENLPTVPAADSALPGSLDLGAFSISLTVADLGVSREFYEKLGFEVSGGAVEHDYLILKNGETTLGLFHGMFDRNIITFNPGLTNRMERVESFTDIREIQRRLDEAGLPTSQRADDEPTGPASLTLVDPDGNPVLIDQFF